jgi:hypothetical protein
MANYESIKDSVENNGEVMIRLGSGEELELHKHNVKFDDNTKEIIVDAGAETYWITAENIMYHWIHREGIKKE